MVVSKHSVHGSLSPFDVTALRFSVSGLILLPIILKKGLKIGRYGIFGSIFLALMMGATYNMLVVFGMRFAPASHAAGIINTTMLICTTLGGVFLLREKTTRLRIAGILVCIIGITCLLEAKGSGDGDSMLKGHMIFMLGGLMWGLYAIAMKAWNADPLHATAAVCCISGIVFMPIYLIFIPSHIGMDNLNEVIFQAIYQGIFTAIIALLCYNRGIMYLGASTSSAFIPLVPVIATLVAIPALGEIPNALEWAGIIIAASGVLLSVGIVDRIIDKRKRLKLSQNI